VISVPENRPQLNPVEAESAIREAYLGDWTPWKGC
jgi:pectinesterase